MDLTAGKPLAAAVLALLAASTAVAQLGDEIPHASYYAAVAGALRGRVPHRRPRTRPRNAARHPHAANALDRFGLLLRHVRRSVCTTKVATPKRSRSSTRRARSCSRIRIGCCRCGSNRIRASTRTGLAAFLRGVAASARS